MDPKDIEQQIIKSSKYLHKIGSNYKIFLDCRKAILKERNNLKKQDMEQK